MRMPELPTRGLGTVRVGRDLPLYPPVGPTKVSSDIYTSESRWQEKRPDEHRQNANSRTVSVIQPPF